MPAQKPGDSPPSANDVIARLQALADKPAEAGHPVEWAVAAYFLGDMTALASLSLRTSG